MTYGVRGRYFESCNCEAICPCRMVGGVRGGRSTYGVCYGVLSWQIEEGRVGVLDVGGLAVALSFEYDDDEPGSPWTFTLHVDARADDVQREALADVFLGRLGGSHVSLLPWVAKARNLIGVRSSTIELVPDGAGYRLRVGDAATLRATTPVDGQEPVACGISGYHRIGTELYADELAVDGRRLEGNCAFRAQFEYVA